MIPEVVPAVELRGLSKTFGDAKALDGVDLTVKPGEIHALLGENGSGKSTLIKVLSGAYVPDRGMRLWVQGKEYDFPLAPGEYRSLGLSFVHQDLGLIPELTVTENLRVSATVASSRLLIPWGKERRQAAALMERYGLAIDPAAKLSTLGQTERTLVALLRAVSELGEQRSLLVLDEPTVFLPSEGTELLFRVVHELVADRKMGVLLVSHDLTEVLAHADHVTVLRGGRRVESRSTQGLTPETLAEVIVGRRVAERTARTDRQLPDTHALTVNGLETRLVSGLDVALREGEILGLTGLAGSGFEEVAGALYGVVPATGSLSMAGESWQLETAGPEKSLQRGMAYVPADRKADGAALELTVGENVTLPALDSLKRGVRVSSAAVRERAEKIVQEYDVRPAAINAPMSNLSGGNAQKAVLGKWLQQDPKVLLLNEPVQGIDVGAKERIFAILAEAADNGLSVVCASSDYDQLCQICDRVIVLASGRPIAEVSGTDLTYQNLSSLVLTSLSHVSAKEATHE